jgi:hypothetical protein
MIQGGKNSILVAVEPQLIPARHLREKENRQDQLDVQRFHGILQTIASQEWRSAVAFYTIMVWSSWNLPLSDNK